MRLSKRVECVIVRVRNEVKDIPEHRLCFAVWERAMLDAQPNRKGERDLAAFMYCVSMHQPHLDVCGIEADWVQKLILESQI